MQRAKHANGVGRRTRGRQVLFSALLALAALQVLASGLLDYCWPQLRCPMYHLQVETAEHRSPPPAVICLGSSRCGCLLDDAAISDLVRKASGDAQAGFFNASVPAGDAEIFERMAAKLFQRNPQPQHAIIELCPENLNDHNEWLPVHIQWYLAWHDVPSHLREAAATGNLMRLVGSRMLAQFIHREAIQRKIAQQVAGWLPRSMDGAAPKTAALPPSQALPSAGQPSRAPNPVAASAVQAVNWERILGGEDKSQARQRNLDASVVRRELRNYRVGGNTAAALERVLTECQSRGIEVTLFTPPLASTHRACYTGEIEQRFQQYVVELTHNYHCQYVDYRDALPDQAFRDHHHASEAARIPFSERLCAELIIPAWKH